MSVKNVVSRQYRAIVSKARLAVRDLSLPNEGWLRTARKALGMSGADLARRLGKSRVLVTNTEKAELDGAVTLKTMKEMAKAMGCRFVYAVVPEDDFETTLMRQARTKAREIVMRTSQHMALEDQSIPKDEREQQIERIALRMIEDMPSDFWKDR